MIRLHCFESLQRPGQPTAATATEFLDQSRLDTLLAHSISDQELERAFEPIDAGDLLMVLDACNSGQALESEEKRRGPMNSVGLAQLAYEKGIYILTAAQAYQAALEASDLGHGFLTYALVEEGLKNGEADREPAGIAVRISQVRTERPRDQRTILPAGQARR